ncbi:MAG TPA: SLBB domain-containing protein [Chitinivibrionales bacterium]|nr:SLBB domain-containing protein [Chitinivibrionales bacterium]
MVLKMVSKTILIISFLTTFSIYAVEPSDVSKLETFENQKINPNTYSSSAHAFSSPPDLINSINPDQYFIGGGDVFFISVIGNSSIQYTGTVNQQCELYVPALGIIKLGKMSLAEAKKQIANYVQVKLKKANNIYVELIEIKKVAVSINGAVANPGTYSFSGAFRLLDALRAANNGALPSYNDCNYREVVYMTSDSIEAIDLFEYLLKNNIRSNPYLYPGSSINISYATRHAIINAPIKSIVGGWVPIKEKEILSELLSFFKFDASADTSKILFQSTAADNQNSARTISWNDAASIHLQDRDIITILQKKNYSVMPMASVTGEVASPGSFPMIRDSTTAKDLLELAGGVTVYGDKSRAAIVRHSKIEGSDSAKILSLSKIQAMGIRPEINAGLSKMTLLEDYSIIELTESNYSIKLCPNDNIVVPRKDNFVYVSGNVKLPGAYEYRSGKSFVYYINLAGGYTNKADRTNVFGIRNYSNVSQIIDLSQIRSADIIVVPDSQEAKFLTIILLPILQTVATIISVVLALYTVAHH